MNGKPICKSFNSIRALNDFMRNNARSLSIVKTILNSIEQEFKLYYYNTQKT